MQGKDGIFTDSEDAKDIPHLDVSSSGVLRLTSQVEMIALTFVKFLYLAYI